MEEDNIPKEGETFLESVFSFDKQVFDAMSVDEQENCVAVIQKVLDDITFQIQLQKHSPKNPAA